MLTTQRPDLYIVWDEIKKRCVFSANNIQKGEIIELCPVILLDSEDTQVIHKTRLHNYYFVWDLAAKTSAIALGYGSLYNHSEEANADFEILPDDMMIKIYATRDLVAGEEICIDYMGLKDGSLKLWFEPV